jgi:hypothetical protein
LLNKFTTSVNVLVFFVLSTFQLSKGGKIWLAVTNLLELSRTMTFIKKTTPSNYCSPWSEQCMENSCGNQN